MLTGTSDASRFIQGHLHTDPYARLEDSNTSEFKQALKEERRRWTKARKPDYSTWLNEFNTTLLQALPKTKDYAHTTVKWNDIEFHIQHTYNHQHHVWIGNTLHYEGLEQFVLGEHTYATIEDTGDGSEVLTLSVYSKTHTRLWQTTPVGPNAAYKGNHIYFQTVENRLRYPGIKMADELTGHRIEELFNESDKKIQIELLQPPFQNDIFIKEANALEQRLGLIVGSKEIKWMTGFHQTTMIPVNRHTYLTNDTIHSNVKKPFPEHEYAIDGLFFNDALYIITVKKGHHTLYEVKDTWRPMKTSSAMKFLHHADTPMVSLNYFWKPSEVYDVLKKKIILTMPSLLTLDHTEGLIEGIPYTIVFKGKPKKLIVSAYGAYGIESQRGYPIRWLPWIKRGYAFAVAMPRGGRDDGDAWWDAGRTAPRKHATFEDTATVIQRVQTRLNISPSKTLFYGRSAGGWVAAMMALQYPHLVKGVIAEVPYVDVLRTTSNPALPLTQMEYEEFGDPLHKKADYEALLKSSPMNIVKEPPVNPPTILIKTALNDTQVATYESLKWAKTLREKGWPDIYVSIDVKGGHFVGQTTMAKQYAEDAAFFHSVVRRVTRKTASHFRRGTTRRFTSSSKH